MHAYIHVCIHTYIHTYIHTHTHTHTSIHAYTGLFRGLGAVAVLDLTLAKEVSVIETCAHAESVYRSHNTAGRVGGKGRGAKQAPHPQKYSLCERTQENTRERILYSRKTYSIYIVRQADTAPLRISIFLLRFFVSGSLTSEN